MDARLTQRRLLLCALAILVFASVASACGGGGDAATATPKDPPLAEFSGSGLSFSYPSVWTATKPSFPYQDLHFHPIVFLSTQPVHAPCTTKGNETDCGIPIAIDTLQPGGVFAMWQPAEGPPLVSGELAPFKGTFQIDGHPAQRKETAGGECSEIGADRTISVEVERATQDYIFFTACLRKPGLAQAEKSVDALLASTKFTAQQS